MIVEEIPAIPSYAPMLTAFHQAFAPELQAMIADVPLHRGDRVLDLASGAASYTTWLAERVGSTGRVYAVDICHDYLKLARTQNALRNVSFHCGSSEALPFDNNTFDVAWCAQSMQSLPDPIRALQELERVTRPGGTVAVFENDVAHQMLLPWPAEMELAVRTAQLQIFNQNSTSTLPYYIGRELRSVFAAANLLECQVRPYTIVRHAPFTELEIRYLTLYLSEIAEFVRPALAPEVYTRFEHYLDPYTWQHELPNSTVIILNLVGSATKPIRR